MNAISSIIATLSNEDKKRFVLNLKQKNKRNDTKNIELFNLLSTDKDITNIDQLLYGKPSKGAYHALSKRLHDALIEFVATKSFNEESSIEMDALKLVLASRILFKHHKNKIAFKTLSKAENKAKKYGLYSILNEVYHTQIMNAHADDSIDLQEIIKKYKKNKLSIQHEDNLNLFYASIHAELKDKNVLAHEIITDNLNRFNISISNNLSYQSLYKILEISNEVGNITRDYYAISEFIENACREIEVSERIDDKYLYEHIKILYYLANTNFRIKKFKASSAHLANMFTYMGFGNEKYFNHFFPHYTLIKTLLNIYSGHLNKALIDLNKFDFIKYKSDYTLDLKLTLAAAFFLQGNFKEALQVFRHFYHSDNWYSNRIGNIWVIKKNLLEILILMELNHFDLVESRLQSFRKKHRTHLLKHNEFRVLEFLKFMTIYYYEPATIKTNLFKEKVDNSLKIKNAEEDVFVLSFYAWLIAKINGAKIYETCIEYIRNK